jgi:hypothetical protein
MSNQIEHDMLSTLKQIYKKLDKLDKQNELNCTRPEFVWSIEHGPDVVIIKYIYDRDFSSFIKNIHFLHWDEYNKGWYAHKDFSDTVYNLLKGQFPEWKCIDKRN